jgi:hypothetical protein
VEGSNLKEVCEILKRGNVEFLRDRRPGLGELFVKTVDRSLSAEPAARFATVAEMARWLRASLNSNAFSSSAVTGS